MEKCLKRKDEEMI